MRSVSLVLLLLLMTPVSGAFGVPEIPEIEGEWVVIRDDGWTHADWVSLRADGLEPLRQISQTEVIVWGTHGDYRISSEDVFRGPEGDGYRVVLEPRLPSHVQWNILSEWEYENLQLAGLGSSLPTSFEVTGVNPELFDSIPGVWWVEPLLDTAARNDVAASIMQHNSMEISPAWDSGLDGTGVVIGVADSGIELDHACFSESGVDIGEIGVGHRKIVLVNTTIDDGDHPGHADYKHGTHIAGSLACDLFGRTNSETHGLSPSFGAKLLFQDVVNESGWSEPTVDWLLAEALVNGVVIHSDSWGDDTEAYTLRSAEFDLWHREVPWSLAFIAPGNNPSKFYEPANARNVVAVGGSLTDNSTDLYTSSSHGPTEEGLRGNFIVAPAVNIMSAAADGDVSSFNYGMRSSTGTSMSTPLGASITAVIQQMVQDGWIRGDNELVAPNENGVYVSEGFVPSGPLLRALLALSAESMEGGQQGSETVGSAPDPLQGWGRPNLERLVGPDWGSATDIWIHDSFRMDDVERLALVDEWLNVNGTRPLEQVANHLWDGAGAKGPFIGPEQTNVTWEFDWAGGSQEDVEIVLSFNQRPFGSAIDDLGVRVSTCGGWLLADGNDNLEGTEKIVISKHLMQGVADDLMQDSVCIEIEVYAESLGLGNYTGILGSDGDMIGFALAVKGIEQAKWIDDWDDDNDGCWDENDDFPRDPTECVDTDGDGVGDNSDPDDDNDGVFDNEDSCPFVYGLTVGNLSYRGTDYNATGCPESYIPLHFDTTLGLGTISVPSTSTCVNDDSTADSWGDTCSAWYDTNDWSCGDFDDADFISSEQCCACGGGTLSNEDEGSWEEGNFSDDDDDGWTNREEVACYWPGDWQNNLSTPSDFDGDWVCDTLDDDDDNDGVLDGNDVCPETPEGGVVFSGNSTTHGCTAEQWDSDEDGFPNDLDDFPDNPGEWNDTDEDGVGDNSDGDIDGDGISNSWEIVYGTDPYNRDTDGDFLDDGEELYRECFVFDDDRIDMEPCPTDPLDRDSDGDGRIDGLDDCPTQWGSGSDGCPSTYSGGESWDYYDETTTSLNPLWVLFVIIALVVGIARSGRDGGAGVAGVVGGIIGAEIGGGFGARVGREIGKGVAKSGTSEEEDVPMVTVEALVAFYKKHDESKATIEHCTKMVESLSAFEIRKNLFSKYGEEPVEEFSGFLEDVGNTDYSDNDEEE